MNMKAHDYRLVEEMYNPLVREMKDILANLREHSKNLTPNQAREDLFRAGLIDENGRATKPYRSNS